MAAQRLAPGAPGLRGSLCSVWWRGGSQRGLRDPQAGAEQYSNLSKQASVNLSLFIIIPIFFWGSERLTTKLRTLGKITELLVPTPNCTKYVCVFCPTSQAYVCEISHGFVARRFQDRDWDLALTLAFTAVRPNLGGRCSCTLKITTYRESVLFSVWCS